MAQFILKIIALAFACTMCTKLYSGEILKITLDPEAETKQKKEVIIAYLHTTAGIPKGCIDTIIFPYIETFELRPRYIFYSLTSLFSGAQWFLKQDKDKIIAHSKTLNGVSFFFAIDLATGNISSLNTFTSSGSSSELTLYDGLLHVGWLSSEHFRTFHPSLQQLPPEAQAGIFIKLRSTAID